MAVEMQARVYMAKDDFYKLIHDMVIKENQLAIPDRATMEIEVGGRTLNVPITFRWEVDHI